MGRGLTRSLSRHVKVKRTRSVSIKPTNDGKGVPEDYFDEDDNVSEPDETRVSDSTVLSKYKTCGQITDTTLEEVAKACVAGASTFDLCTQGNESVLTQCKNIFKKTKDEKSGAKLKRGIAYPCTVSVNNVLCNHSPIDASEAHTLKDGDIVKVHVGTYVDGYTTQAARTIVVGEALNSQRDANALQASVVALNAMIRMMRPGTVNDTITDAIEHVGHHYDVNSCEGVLSNRTKRWVVDGQQAIIGRRIVKELPQQDVFEVEIGEFQVWTLDVAFTTSDSYKLNLTDENCYIYRKNEVEDHSSNRHEAADYILQECMHNLEHFPFTVNQCAQPLKAKMGIKSINHQFDLFPAMKSKAGQVTTRACCTIAVTNKRIHILAGQPAMPSAHDFNCVKDLPEGLAEVLAFPLTLAKKEKTSQDEEEDAAPKKAVGKKAKKEEAAEDEDERPKKKQRRN